MNRLEQIAKRLAEIKGLLESDQTLNIEELEKEVKALNEEKAQIESRAALANAINAGAVVTNPIDGAPKEPGAQQRAAQTDPVVDPLASVQYRKAFMDFAIRGTPIPDGLVPAGIQRRSDDYTGTGDVGAVIPSTILDEVIKELKTYGQLFRRVRKMSIRGGVNVPILSLKPQATWITEAAPSDRQKVTATSSVQFSYYGLECKVAVSLLADTVTLPSFESTIVSLIVEAMAQALDNAIINGGGTTEPVGIVNDVRIAGGQKITLSSSEIVEWEEWKKKVFAKIPLSYRAGGVFIMASGTFEGYIDGMVDANGQPIGRVNYGITQGPQERFGGREVVLVEDDIIAPYEAASNGDVIAVFARLQDYAINSNMQMTMYRWLDHDTNQWVDKAILIADGKLLDTRGVLLIKKGA